MMTKRERFLFATLLMLTVVAKAQADVVLIGRYDYESGCFIHADSDTFDLPGNTLVHTTCYEYVGDGMSCSTECCGTLCSTYCFRTHPLSEGSQYHRSKADGAFCAPNEPYIGWSWQCFDDVDSGACEYGSGGIDYTCLEYDDGTGGTAVCNCTVQYGEDPCSCVSY